MSAPLLEARGLAVSRGRRPVLQAVDLTLRAGEALAVVGPNGAGKSTLVRALGGLLPPSAGEVLVLGRALADWSGDALGRALALVASEDQGPDALAVEDRVRLGRYPHRGPFRSWTREDGEAVSRALAQAGIEHLRRRALGTLSAGERQLAALARGLAQEPRILLLDEPAAHLDIGHQLRLFRVLDDVRAAGVGVLAVAHDLPRAAAWATRMVLVAGGRVAAQGGPDEVLAGEACASAFQVKVRGHRLADVPHPLYWFEEEPR
ncbi:MAG TPA: ABC transporter ATP-binding protein [Vicinamibacteria bacterium]|nr:ABC transporter ATP-binding protein [Vicinamibacteria bacterium]